MYFYDVWLDTFSQAQRAYSRTIAGHVPSLLEERSNRVLALVLEERAGLFARIALLSIELELSTKAEIVRLNNAMAYQYAAVVATELGPEFLNRSDAGQDASRNLMNMCMLSIASDQLRAERVAKFILKFPSLDSWKFINAKTTLNLNRF